MISPGLLIDGALYATPGVTVVPPASHGGPAWNALHADDYAVRSSAHVGLIVIHTTGGHWPQPVIPGSGPPGHARQIAEMWSGQDRGGGERVHSGAQIIVDYDGTVYCLCDLERCAAYHAQMINARSVGIEMSTKPDGSIYDATLEATAILVALLAWSGTEGDGLFSIPAQMPRGPYHNAPLRRLELNGAQSSGAGVVGVIGHRDQTSQRGFGDPGNAIWGKLAARGFEGMDYDGEEDLVVGRARQHKLVAQGAKLTIDGIVGPATIAAASRLGYSRMRDVA